MSESVLYVNLEYNFSCFYKIEVSLTYNVVLISGVQQSDSVITYIYVLFNFIFHYGLSQDIEYSSLCYPEGPCHLSILYVIPCI